MVAVLVLLVVAGVFGQVGQTYYYVYVESVDAESGVRSKKSSMSPMYITFTKNACYISNKDGIKSGNEFPYQGEKNNLYTFLYRNTQKGKLTVMSYDGGINLSSNVTDAITRDYHEYLYFSKDYKRINKRIFNGKTDTSGTMTMPWSAYGMWVPGSDNTTPGKAASWNNNIDIYERSTPPAPPPPPPDGSEAPTVLY